MLYLASALNDFMQRYHEVSVDISLTDRFVDVLHEGYDVSIRIAALADTSLVARRIANCRRVYCATPGYLLSHGRPRQPVDLSTHRCLLNTNSPQPGRWEFHPAASATAACSVTVTGPLATDSGPILYSAALAGQVIALLPTIYVGADLRAGPRERVLPDYGLPNIGLHALYASRRFLSARTRASVEFLITRFAGVPEWDQGLDDARPRTNS